MTVKISEALRDKADITLAINMKSYMSVLLTRFDLTLVTSKGQGHGYDISTANISIAVKDMTNMTTAI